MERDHPAKLQMNHPSSTAHAAELFLICISAEYSGYIEPPNTRLRAASCFPRMDLWRAHKSKEGRHVIMSQDKEILTHLVRGESQRHIAAGLHVSRNTVARVAAAIKRLSLSPLMWKKLSEVELHQQLFPASAAAPVPVMPDFNYIHRELLRNGIVARLSRPKSMNF